MSKVSISGDQNGTGNFQIKAPNSNTDRTLTLRDETGDLVTTATDLEPQVKDSLNATGTAPVYACRAWVNFSGDNTAIRDSGNVSSITDISTGNFIVNFSTSMPDANYAYSVTSEGGGSTNICGAKKVDAGSDSSKLFIVFRRLDNDNLVDVGENAVAIFR